MLPGAAAAQMMQQAPKVNPAPAPTATPAPIYIPPPAPPPYVPPQSMPQTYPSQEQPPPPAPPYIPPLFIPQYVPPPYVPPPPAAPAPQVQMQAQQPVLPPVFRGCWMGRVDQVDDIQRLPGAHKLGYWTPKTYKLCYKRVGNGPYDLTFGETGVVASEKIQYSRGKVTVLETDGRTSARIRAFLHFDEYRKGAGPGGPTFPVDEATILDCRINGDSMLVNATVDGRREDEPWFRARWHAVFTHSPR